jgi:hypothetical protein
MGGGLLEAGPTRRIPRFGAYRSGCQGEARSCARMVALLRRRAVVTGKYRKRTLHGDIPRSRRFGLEAITVGYLT